jgi:hypothetical protein
MGSLMLERGHKYCRGCGSESIYSGLDLGELPIANELVANPLDSIDVYALHLKICSVCSLGQVADVVTSDRIFRDYRYLSSISTTFTRHAAEYVSKVVKDLNISESDWVLEIASNDGYLLKNFQERNISCIGVEPAENVANISRTLGITTINDFFTRDLANSILEKYGFPKLIIANNVMAHVPDLQDFLQGLQILTGPDTTITIENPSLNNILTGMQFDTIYHEHFSYLTATCVDFLSSKFGLRLVKVEHLSTHGGSLRYWLNSLETQLEIQSSVNETIQSEKDAGLFDISSWEILQKKVSMLIAEFSEWLKEKDELGESVAGYGAAAKASTLLNCMNLETLPIQAIADGSPEKQNRFMPTKFIPIISPQELFSNPTDHIVIFPWNIEQEIVQIISANVNKRSRVWVVVPTLREIQLK